jgi:dimethylamine monooxygenase subunit A
MSCNIGQVARYFPLDNGRYEVKPGMAPLGKCFGNGVADNLVFQIDDTFADYRFTKMASRQECLSKYFQTSNYSDTVAATVAKFIIGRLQYEHPQYFYVEKFTNGIAFNCQLTQETLYFDKDYQLLNFDTKGDVVLPPLINTLDALAAQVQEDITVICRADNRNWIGAIHLCFPNHWSAEDKIGKDFATVHTPVAGIKKINQRAQVITNTMIVHQPMVRFAWGLSTDTRLNHHPQPPQNTPVDIWSGRKFDINNPELYLRIERQVIWGLPECDAALFTIRTYFRNVAEIKQDACLRQKLVSAIKSMTPESLIYKGLLKSRDDILVWLQNIEN